MLGHTDHTEKEDKEEEEHEGYRLYGYKPLKTPKKMEQRRKYMSRFFEGCEKILKKVDAQSELVEATVSGTKNLGAAESENEGSMKAWAKAIRESKYPVCTNCGKRFNPDKSTDRHCVWHRSTTFSCILN